MSLLLLAALNLQNPNPPDVTLPEGWNIHFWSSAGHGNGALLGPNHEEIIFPGYGGTGNVA